MPVAKGWYESPFGKHGRLFNPHGYTHAQLLCTPRLVPTETCVCYMPFGMLVPRWDSQFRPKGNEVYAWPWFLVEQDLDPYTGFTRWRSCSAFGDVMENTLPPFRPVKYERGSYPIHWFENDTLPSGRPRWYFSHWFLPSVIAGRPYYGNVNGIVDFLVTDTPEDFYIRITAFTVVKPTQQKLVAQWRTDPSAQAQPYEFGVAEYEELTDYFLSEGFHLAGANWWAWGP